MGQECMGRPLHQVALMERAHLFVLVWGGRGEEREGEGCGGERKGGEKEGEREGGERGGRGRGGLQGGERVERDVGIDGRHPYQTHPPKRRRKCGQG